MYTINEDHIIYGSWNIRCDRQKFLSFWAIFCPFSPLTTWKIKILTFKKTPEDIIILHICTINDNHMMYGSWNMECDRQFFVILDHFLPFYPPMDQENQNFRKNGKKYLNILSSYKHKWQSYDVWFLRYGVQWTEFFVILDVFCPFTPLTIQKIKILKKWKKNLEILPFYTWIT